MSAARSSRPASTFKVANVRTGRLDSPLAVIPFFVSYLLPVVFLRSTRSRHRLARLRERAVQLVDVRVVRVHGPPRAGDGRPGRRLANPTDVQSRRAAKDWRTTPPVSLGAAAARAGIVFGARAFATLSPRSTGESAWSSPRACAPAAWASPSRTSCCTKTKSWSCSWRSFCSPRCATRTSASSTRRTSSPGGDAGNDPATAERGGSFYGVWVRSVYGTYADGAWRIWRGENDHDLGVAAKRTFGARVHERRAPFPRAVVRRALLRKRARRARRVFFLARALVAATLLELVNYVEHYGLRRERVEVRLDPRGVREGHARALVERAAARHQLVHLQTAKTQ